MATLTPSPLMQFFTANGAPLVGGLLYTYAAGTTTPQSTYTTSAGTTANTNPVVMNSRGEAAVWLDSALYYMELKDSTGALIWTADNVGSLSAGVTNYMTVTGANTLLGTYTQPLSAYVAGLTLSFVAAATNSGAATLNINNLGVKDLTKDGATALAAADIKSGDVTLVVYDGTRFQLINPMLALPGTSGNVLTSNGTSWTSSASSIVSSFSAGSTGFTPSTATTGAVTLAGTLIAANGGTGLTSPGTTGNVLTSTGSAWTSSTGSRVTLATAQASTSGTSIDFTGIPAAVKRITVMFTGVRATDTGTGNAAICIQIGDSGGIETTGYASSSNQPSYGSVVTTAFPVEPYSDAAQTLDGAMNLSLTNSSAYSWVASGVVGSSSGGTKVSGGSKSLSAELDRVRITTVGGTSAFTAGSINIQYEI